MSEITRSELLRRVLAATLLAGLSLGITACNTMEGFGEDVRATGDAIDDEAEEASE